MQNRKPAPPPTIPLDVLVEAQSVLEALQLHLVTTPRAMVPDALAMKTAIACGHVAACVKHITNGIQVEVLR